MGADFDRRYDRRVLPPLPGTAGDVGSGRGPSALAWDELLQRAMFVPGKQYLFGLHRLMKGPERLQALQQELARRGGLRHGPPLRKQKAALEAWVARHWWACIPKVGGGAIVERHALDALAPDPGMGLGLYSAEELGGPRRRPLRCRQGGTVCGRKNRAVCTPILRGESLESYRRRAKQVHSPADPIGEVMLAAKVAVGRFGGVLRRLLFSAAQADSGGCPRRPGAHRGRRHKKVLSVKAGETSLCPSRSMMSRYGGCWGGEALLLPEEPAELRELLEGAGELGLWRTLQAAVSKPVPAWLEWLRKPAAAGRVARKVCRAR